MSAPSADRAAELTGVLAELSRPDLPAAQRRRHLRRLARRLPRPRGRRGLADSVALLAPYVPVRELPLLRAHHPGLDGDLLADRLVRNAARATAGIGAAGGALAAVTWAVPPTLLSAPVLLGAETVAVAAVELKLVGELHEVYRTPVPGRGTRRAATLVQAWARQRGVTAFAVATGGAGAVLGGAARRELAQRLARRFGRNLPTLAPLLAGATAGGYLNQRATRALAREIRADLAVPQTGGAADLPATAPWQRRVPGFLPAPR